MKSCCILLLSLLIIAGSHAQTPKWIWAKSSGTTNSHEHSTGSGIATDAAGNVFVTGFFDSTAITFGTTTLNSSGPNDIFLAKYDASGNILWAKSAGGTDDDEAYGVATDLAGNSYITGYFKSPSITFGTTTLVNSGGSIPGDVFLAKYDPSGNVVWAKKAAGVGDDTGYGVATDVLGNVFVTGFFASPSITFGTTTLSNVSPGDADVFLAKYDNNGNVLWAKSAGGTNGDIAESVATDASGNVFITGYFEVPSITFGTTTLTNSGLLNAGDVFIVKYDASGNVLWAKSAGGPQGDEGAGVATDVSGNVFVTGWFESQNITFGTTTLPNAAAWDVSYFLAKYDASGNSLWARGVTGATNDDGWGVATDGSGNAFVAGGFNCPSITFGTTTLTMPPGGNTPLFIAKYDPSGNVLCASALADGGSYKNAIATDALGNAYITGGSFANPLAVGATTLPLAGAEEVVVAKYSCCSNAMPAITGLNKICRGDSVTLQASGSSIYSWSNGASGSTINISPAITTTYTVDATDAFGCKKDTSFTVTVNPKPVAGLSGNTTVYQGSTTTLTASGGGTYAWSNGDSTQIITVSPAVTTAYCVTVADSNNCKNKACLTVLVESPCDTAGQFYFPNTFSPNGDGNNDVLKFYYNEKGCIESLHLIIYDRWGEQVFETSDKDFVWDGIYRNEKLNTQELVYRFTVLFTDGKTIVSKGNLSLLR
jgi:gliding motility-associated-like protein